MSVGISACQWKSVRVSGNQWELVGISGSQWESVGVSGSQWMSVAGVLRYTRDDSLIACNSIAVQLPI